RSDSMMVLTIDEKNNDIRITSLARDTYVQIPGYGEEKLTHAYAYGGPALLLQTIDKNFGLKIDKYAVVSFSSFEKII
ncbi:LCP family protein, partial [Faecalibacillus intestinalis]